MMRFGLIILTALGLLLRIGYALSLYDPSLLNYYLDDYTSYRMAAEDILQGDLAFTNGLYLKRPPLFSLLVAALGIQPGLVIAVNILLGTGIIPLTYVLARQLRLSHSLALLAALIVAIDPTSVRYSSVLLAEPLANLLLAIAFVSIMALKQAGRARAVVMWGLLGGAAIALSALTRPAAYLLWIPMAVWVVFARRQWRVLAGCSLAVLALSGMLAWQQHNAAVFDNRTYSTAGTFQLLYVRAASVLHQATGDEIDDVYAILARRVEERLGNEVQGITANWRHRHLASTAQMQSVMTEVALEVFYEYPLYYLLTIPVGLYRTLVEVSRMPVWLSIGWNVPFLLAAAYGLWHLVRQRRFADAAFLFLPSAYFLTGTLLVATASIDTRARVMAAPLLAVLAAYAALRWMSRADGAAGDGDGDDARETAAAV